jgi:hypothetical protein
VEKGLSQEKGMETKKDVRIVWSRLRKSCLATPPAPHAKKKKKRKEVRNTFELFDACNKPTSNLGE